MKNIFNYCVYRIANTYKKFKMKDFIGQGYFLMFVAFTFYALALTECILSIFDLRINKVVIALFCLPTIIEVLFFQKLFPNNELVFKECDTKYHHERFHWIKGAFVFLFVSLSIVCYIIALVAFESP